ncbi:MAG: hypothetical protein Alpg2KO_19240 [Alphaproteobacteria bacterium]
MRKFIRKFITAIMLFPSAIFLAMLAIHNKHGVELNVWPFTAPEAPPIVNLGLLLMAVAVCFFALGIAICAVTLTSSILRASEHDSIKRKYENLKAKRDAEEREKKALTSVETAKGREVAVSQS